MARDEKQIRAPAKLPSHEEIEAARTPAGGWKRKQLELWGVPWPPPRGWKKALEAAAAMPVVEAGTKVPDKALREEEWKQMWPWMYGIRGEGKKP